MIKIKKYKVIKKILIWLIVIEFFKTFQFIYTFNKNKINFFFFVKLDLKKNKKTSLLSIEN